MPEDTQMIAEATEKADSAESLDKSKHLVDVSSKAQELQLSVNDMKASVKPKKTSNKIKKDNKQKDMISSIEISAKDICNTKQRNGYTKSDITETTDNTQPTLDNEKNAIIEEEVNAVNGHEADDTDIEEELQADCKVDDQQNKGLYN